ncbi:keratin-associated protein 5-4-like [Drosophila miranda]|uniref:Keratin-associated protein 5-4 n=1 Tax=Drosophila pseudoobscura pseudoobscura TaxID=46245 RepID=A0A6I8VX90_DROPS|nr:keratin-associated protein 5-4 [Drosophila miranda]XP_017155068.1 keratin-associated protein 5-4-like [Drosophila miranda]XP_017155072.1 keratin-associated protein 5-4-like [Drosophila miranda]XP_033235541.1 keratin-associated protein 5-4-like [Drosophila pseudoobscura]XP_033235705.1 keratin-associated protein 5-4 [Drosophila pseudoobscura]XP_033250125.1 keratin-associated protein 5-4-like [Drosophila miranda]
MCCGPASCCPSCGPPCGGPYSTQCCVELCCSPCTPAYLQCTICPCYPRCC